MARHPSVGGNFPKMKLSCASCVHPHSIYFSQAHILGQLTKAGSEEGFAMENRVSDTVETRKTWVAPELKKVDVEEVTAVGAGPGGDGSSQS